MTKVAEAIGTAVEFCATSGINTVVSTAVDTSITVAMQPLMIAASVGRDIAVTGATFILYSAAKLAVKGTYYLVTGTASGIYQGACYLFTPKENTPFLITAPSEETSSPKLS